METSTTKQVRALSDPPAGAGAADDAAGKKKKQYLAMGAVVAILAISIGGYAIVTAGQENTDDAQVESDVVPLAARTGGLVLKVMVAENQTVRAGDVIMQLDEADQAAKVAQAEAELATSRAQVAAAEAQIKVVDASAKGGLQSARAAVSGSSVAVQSASAQINAVRAGLERAKAEVRKAELDLNRAKALRAANAVPQESLDNAQIGYDAAQAELEQATANLAASEQAKTAAESHVLEAQGRLGQSTPIEAQIASAHAALDLATASAQAAQARLDLQRLQFSYLKVAAPVNGVISRLTAHQGQLLQTGQAIAELVPENVYIIANFKETQVGHMKPGQDATISIDAFDGHDLHGKVASLSGGTGARFSLLPPDNASGNFVKVVQRVPVRIEFTDVPQGVILRAGLSADVTVKVKE